MDEILKQLNIFDDLKNLLSQSSMIRVIVIVVLATIIAYYISKYSAKIIIKLAQRVSVRGDKETNEDKYIRLRQVETYLSVAVAIVRVFVVFVVAYVAFLLITNGKYSTNKGFATIGAGAFFIVFAGQSLGAVIRDLTSGSAMIIEQWFNVGDHIKIEPFSDAKGVVEKLSLRSTKIRRLSGEVLWVHNQFIQGVHVTPRGIRTIIVDVFVNDIELGEAKLLEIIRVVPSGRTLMTKPLRIISKEQWSDNLWKISVIGYTAPGREWLIERFFVNAIKDVDVDAKSKKDRIFTYEPIARYADPLADKKFLRSINHNGPTASK